MDASEYLAVVQQDEHSIYGNVEVYGDVDDPGYVDYTSQIKPVVGHRNPEGLLESSLKVASNLFEARTEDILNVKIEQVDVPCNDHVPSATDDESMAVEALRQLGNSRYTNNTSPRIETSTPHDLPLLPCSTCELEFRTTSDLNSHSEICRHSQFVCPICNESFERKLDLNNHLVCHAVDRPHACRICGTLFIQKQDLLKHTLSHGSHTSNQCQVCGQQFGRPSSLTNHMKIHNYQPGRALALLSPKVESVGELNDILTGTSDPQMQPVEKITLPSINNMTPMSNWNLNYEPENFNTDINLDVPDEVTIVDNKLEIIQIQPEIQVLKPQAAVLIDKKKPHCCTRCPKTFAREKALINHLNLHKDVLDNYYTCERCDQTFNNATALDKHLQFCGITPKVQKVLPVTNVNVAPVTDDPLTIHTSGLLIQKVEHPRNPPPTELMKDSSFDLNVYNKIYKHSCLVCGKNFTTKQKLFRHMWIHRKKTFACELCPKTFEQQEQLDSHRLATHQSGSPYVCPECGKNFSSRQGLWEHNRIHTTEINSFKCVECAKQFTSRQGYLIHKRKHTDERPYGCRFCWKAFRDGGTLRKHERIHTGERPHACPLCSKAFNQKVVLREHIRWLHTAHLKPNEDSVFICSICSTRIADKDELCAHFVRHSDQMAQLAKDASKSNISKVEETKSFAPIEPKLERTVEISKMEIEILIETDVGNVGHEVENADGPLLKVHREPPVFQQVLLPHKLEDNLIDEVSICKDVACDLCGLVFMTKNDLSEHVRIHI